MKRVYNAIMSALEKNAAQFEVLGVKPPETFDVHLGQEQSPDQFEFFLPAVFYDYSVDYTAEYLYVYLYVIQDYEDDTENFAKNKDLGERFFDFLTALKRCLNNVKIPQKAFGKLTLYQEQPQNNDFFYCHLLSFRCQYRAELDDDLNPETPKQEYFLSLKKGKLRDRLE